MGGYPCFVITVVTLGALSSFLGDLTSLLGCTVGLEDSVTAVGIVAFGTTVPGNVVRWKMMRSDDNVQVKCCVFTSLSMVGETVSESNVRSENSGSDFTEEG